MTVELIPITGLPEIAPGDDLGEVLAPRLRAAEVADGDVVVVTSKIVSKAEGRLVAGADRSEAIAHETVRVLARRDDLVITETRHGFVCANAGVDASNLAPGTLALLPDDPDGSAARLRDAFAAAIGLARLGVVITDTFGRAWRTGLVNVAIGCAGIPAVVDERGRPDHHGRPLEATVVAYADEIAAASGLVMAKDARVPVAIVRGLRAPQAPDGTATDLIRPREEDLFRESPLQTLAVSGSRGAFTSDAVPRDMLERALKAALADTRSMPPGGLRFTVATTEAGRRAVRAELGAVGATLPDAPVAIVATAGSGADDAQVGVVLERLRLALHGEGLGVGVAEPGGPATRGPQAPVGIDGGARVVGLLACGWAPAAGGPEGGTDDADDARSAPTPPTIWR